MDTNEQDQPDMEFEDTLSDQSVHSDSPETSDTLEESELHPRVGDEYQADIPFLLTPSEQLNYFSNPCDFLLGLPVPVKYAFNGAKSIKDEGAELHDSTNYVKEEANEGVTECSSVSDKKEPIINGDSADQKCVGCANGYGFVPGLRRDSWSEFEVDSFLLGLYLFRKNLLEVKEFMEVKEMGQILSFYYQRFYRTPRYQRWVDFRKIKGRRCIIGQRILSGSRQPELLSRLLPHLSEVSRDTAVEAYRALMDGRSSLFSYVSTLKTLVGIHSLVEAVRIGKSGDLAVMAMESSRSNLTISSRSEPPTSKECSSLTYSEIVQYLTGGFRLSKGRSSDLFWEAVWPRLLAKGWHSEKPKDHYLVFLLPGIDKFRRKLSRGDHYFDSFSDVLKKVASKPELLVLESEESGFQRYLKPRSSSSDAANDMKFSIVDTSNQSRVKEVRSLTDEMKNFLEKKPAKKNFDQTLKRRKLNACGKGGKKHYVRRCSESSLRQQNFVLSLPAHPKKPVRKKVVEETQLLIDLNIPLPPCEPEAVEQVADVKMFEDAKKVVLDDQIDAKELFEVKSLVPSNGQIFDALEVYEDIKLGDQMKHTFLVEEGNQCGRETNAEQDEKGNENENGRRQSTRIRPPSTRALEAMETSFLNTKVGKKRSQGEEEKPKVSRRARSKTRVKPDGVGGSGTTARPDQTHDAETVTEPGPETMG